MITWLLPGLLVVGSVLVVIAYQLFNKTSVSLWNVDQLIKSFHDFEQEISDNQHWTLLAVEQGVRIWEKQRGSGGGGGGGGGSGGGGSGGGGSGGGGYKCEVVVTAPMEIVTRVLEVPAMEKHWNPALESLDILEQTKDGAHDIHIVRMIPRQLSQLLGFFLFKRVFTVARVKEISPNEDECYLMLKSVRSTNDPEPSYPHIRGHVRLGGFKVKRLDRTSSHVTFSMDQDLGSSWLPFRLLEGWYSRRLAFQTALGLREFFSHLTLTDISMRLYDLTKDDPHFQPQRRVSPAKITTTPSHLSIEKNQRAIAQGKKSIEAFLKAVTDDAGWVTLPEVSRIQIKTKRAEGNMITGVMGTGIVQAPPKAILDAVMNIKDKKQLDTMFAEGRIVEVVDEHTCVVYQAYEPVWPTSARDFCCLQYWTRLADGSYVLTVTETTHAQCGERQGHVRGAIILAGYLLKPRDDGLNTDVVYYAMTDLKGNVPLSVVNVAIQKNPLVIEGIRNYVAKLDLTSYIVGSEDPALTPEKHSPVTPREPVPRDIEQSLDHAFRELLRESAPELETSGKGGGGWGYVETKKDIVILRKVLDNSPAHCFKGEGTINRPMADIRDYLLTVPARTRYDSMCKKIRCVREYDSLCQLIHTVHTTTQCMLKTEREFLFATQYRVDEETNRHVVVAKSIDRDDLCPKNPEMVRGDIVMAGWILTPMGRSTKVVYIVQVDLKGKIPASVVNLVSVKQPLCIHYLRRAMDEDLGEGPGSRKGSASSDWSI